MIQPPIAILKSLWARRDDGLWAVTELKGLNLKPKEGCEPDYFTIDSDIELMTRRLKGMSLHQVFTSFGTTEFLMRQSILPIVAWCDGDELIRTIGTASVISCSGYLLTAAHVLIDPFESGYGASRTDDGLDYADGLNFGAFVPINPATGRDGVTFFPFEKWWLWGKWKQSPLVHESAQFELATDVAVCKIPELPHGAAHQPLSMSLNPFITDEAAYSVGYAEMAPIPIEYKNGAMSIRKFPAELYVSIGKVREVFPMNHKERNRPLTPGPCFEFDAKIPGKMSGAPVFGGGGAVIRGVVSTSLGDQRSARGSMLGPAMDLPLDEPQTSGRTLRSLMQGENEGIAQVYGSGL
jgi:hypothetical protein